jgi:hypothetical protein
MLDVRRNLFRAMYFSEKRNLISGFKQSELIQKQKTKDKLHGLSPRANYTDRATASCQRSYFQLLQIEGATWLA